MFQTLVELTRDLISGETVRRPFQVRPRFVMIYEIRDADGKIIEEFDEERTAYQALRDLNALTEER
jgi:hypothetical protein